MIKRTLYFGNAVWIRLAQNQLVVAYKSDAQPEKRIPVEDIGIVIIDHPQISLSHQLVNALISQNAAVLWCDNRHMPNGMVLPIEGKHDYTEKLRYQLNASVPLKKQLWKQTIQSKIRNQAALLETLDHDVSPLIKWLKEVTSGDRTNIEAKAARWYWSHLFHDHTDFTRLRQGPAPNHLLNYGYAILRSIVARSLVSSGMLPAIGIHHHNKYNSYCLADDIMEPYRPYVDQVVYELWLEHDRQEIELTTDIKKELLQLPVIDVHIEGKTSPLMVGMQRTTASLMACFEGHKKKIDYPQMHLLCQA